MKVKKFEAVDMQEALRKVKAELGPHAVIIQTRKIVKDKSLFGLFGRPVIEVTAAIESHTVPSRQKKAAAPLRTSNNRARSGLMQDAELPPLPQKEEQPPQQPAYNALAFSEEAEKLHTSAKERSAEPSRFDDLAVVSKMISPLKDDVNELKSILDKVAKERSDIELEQAQTKALQAEMSDIRTMLDKLLKANTTDKERLDIPPALSLFFERMIKNGLDERIALKLVQKAKETIGSEFAQKESYIEAYLGNFIAKLVKIEGPMQLAEGMCKIVAFIGATGVGKTTTIAKVAARYKLQEKKKVALFTFDTFRIAAVEQLRTYANILGLPVEVVMTPAELQSKIREYKDFDLILVDTAGRSQRESGQMVELKAFLDVMEHAEKHLLLSATSNIKVLNETIERFEQVGYDTLLFTKLDEGGLFGQILNLSVKVGKPLSYFTIGQRVPEDIELASAERVADLVLNH